MWKELKELARNAINDLDLPKIKGKIEREQFLQGACVTISTKLNGQRYLDTAGKNFRTIITEKNISNSAAFFGDLIIYGQQRNFFVRIPSAPSDPEIYKRSDGVTYETISCNIYINNAPWKLDCESNDLDNVVTLSAIPIIGLSQNRRSV